MRTERQRAASRINGARSRGPVTDAGKRASSRNSRRHCLYAKDIPPDLQLPALDSPPSTDPAHDLLVQAALHAHHDRMRIAFLGARIMNEEIARQRLIHPTETSPSLHALAFRRLADETGTLHALYRLEGAATRRWERAMDRIGCHKENQFCETNPTIPPHKRACNRRVAHADPNGARVERHSPDRLPSRGSRMIVHQLSQVTPAWGGNH
jgi:hypothetical protein